MNDFQIAKINQLLLRAIKTNPIPVTLFFASLTSLNPIVQLNYEFIVLPSRITHVILDKFNNGVFQERFLLSLVDL